MRRYASYLVLPRGDKFIGYVWASSSSAALDTACTPCEGIAEYLPRGYARTCCDDTIYVERSRTR